MSKSTAKLGSLPRQDDEKSPAQLDRRSVCGAIALGVTAAGCSGGNDADGSATKALPRTTVAELDRVSDDPLNFEYPDGRDAFIIKLGRKAEGGIGPDEDIVAYHRACPHRGCAIDKIDIERAELGPCRCHLSTFDLSRAGLQVFGVSSQNLVQIELEESDDGEIIAVGLKGLAYGKALRIA